MYYAIDEDDKTGTIYAFDDLRERSKWIRERFGATALGAHDWLVLKAISESRLTVHSAEGRSAHKASVQNAIERPITARESDQQDRWIIEAAPEGVE